MFQVDVLISHTIIVPNVIKSHWMFGCGMLQAQGQNAMQFKCVQMSIWRFSDFTTNSRAMTSMSMLYSLSVCTCRTARWLSRCWLIELRKYVFRRRSDEKLRSTKKLKGSNTLLVPQPKSWGGGLVSPGPRGCCAYARRGVSYPVYVVFGNDLARFPFDAWRVFWNFR